MRCLFLLALGVVLTTTGCGPTYSLAIRHGATFSHDATFSRGYYPSGLLPPPLALRVSAVGLVSLSKQPTLRVAAALGPVGLFADSGRAARVTIHFHLEGPTDSTFADTLTLHRQVFRPDYIYQARLLVPPGRYKVRLGAINLKTGTHVTRRAYAMVPVPDPQGPSVSAVRAAVKDSGGWHPMVSYSVAGRPDSLRFTVRVATDSASPLTVRAYLLRFRADHTIHHNLEIKIGSLVYRGINYNDSTVVYAKRRRLPGGSNVQIRFVVRGPPRGDYRFEVLAGGQRKARDFAVRSPGFPAAVTPRERAAPLFYLMMPQEAGAYNTLMNVTNPDTLRAAVAHFWRSHIGNPAKARRVADLYYRQVRRANRLFSNYKEGWKTTRGALYILWGPPDEILHHTYSTPPAGYIDGKFWIYSNCDHCTGDGWPIFRARKKSAAFPFEQYFITYNNHPDYPIYFSSFMSKVVKHLWLSGDILKVGFRGLTTADYYLGLKLSSSGSNDTTSLE